MRRYGLPCHRLTVGDCCISLTRRLQNVSGVGRARGPPISTTPESCATSGDVAVAAPRAPKDGNGSRGHVSHGLRFPNTAAETATPVDFSRFKSPAPGAYVSGDPPRNPSHLSTAVKSDGLPVLPPLLPPVLQHPVTVSVGVGRSMVVRKRRHSDSDAGCSSAAAATDIDLDSGEGGGGGVDEHVPVVRPLTIAPTTNATCSASQTATVTATTTKDGWSLSKLAKY